MSCSARLTALLCLAISMFHVNCRQASSHKKKSRDFTVAPGKFAEVNVRMVKGARVAADFEASAEVAWDTHSHPAGKTVTHSKGNSSKGTLSITAKKRTTYSFLWKNESKQPVTLRLTIDLPKGTEVSSWVGHK